MKSVPSIVASATIVGLSSIGFALARPDDHRILPKPRKRRHSLENHSASNKNNNNNNSNQRSQSLGFWPGASAQALPGAAGAPRPGTSVSSPGPSTPLTQQGQAPAHTTASANTSSCHACRPSRPHDSRPELASTATWDTAALAITTPTSATASRAAYPGAAMDASVSPPLLSHSMAVTTSIHPSLRPAHAIAPPTSNPRPPRTSPLPVTNASSSTSRQSYDGRTASGKVRRLDIRVEDAAQQRREDHERAVSPAAAPVGAPEEAIARPRPRTRNSSSRNSWIKRLSAAMSSRSASPAPSESGSPNLSIESKPFSRSSSSAPIIGFRPATAIAGPNKLVKRSSSQRLLGDSDPSSRRLTLRRPATSHQRTAALHYHATLRNSQNLSNQAQHTPEEEIRWRQYFTVRVPKLSKSQKRHSSYDSGTIRRILPDKKYKPTLISTKTILTSSFDIDDVSDHDDDFLDFESRPASAIGHEAHTPPFTPIYKSSEVNPEEPSIQRDSLQQPASGRDSEDLAASGRFSFQGLLRRKSSRKHIEQTRPRKLIRRSSRRVHSEPMGTVRRTDSSDDERPAKRRHADESKAFRIDTDTRPSVQLGDTSANLAAVGDAFSSTSPLPSGQSSPYMPSEATSPDIPQQNFNRAKVAHMSSVNPVAAKLATGMQGNIRVSTTSAAASEHTSTLVGSDVEAGRGLNLFDDDLEDTDHSTLFDSLKTRGTRSTSGAYRTKIDTIFDESPSPPISSSPKLRDILPQGMLSSIDHARKDHQSVIEEEDIMATPVRTIRSDRADDGSPIAPRTKSRAPLPPHFSSPPPMHKALSLGTLEYDDQLEDDGDDSRWSAFDEDSRISGTEDWDVTADQLPDSSSQPLDDKRPSVTSTSSSVTPKSADKDARRDTRSNIFDWSEQANEKIPGKGSPPRPRTVHGKKDTDRGSRSTGRRAPSGLHARSQSVPVVPALAGKRETVMTNKFGTWGVGSKGVSEEYWDDDFDFGDGIPQPSVASGSRDERRIDSGVVIHIPQTIRESQVNVVNNIGLVREFGLLVEELKVLRARAVKSGQLELPRPPVWEEIDAMIDLADQEVDDPLFPAQPSLPSSPPHDPDPFEDSTENCHSWQKSTPDPRRSRSRRRSVLPNAENDVFSTPTSQTNASFAPNSSPLTNPPSTRPRKDSEAMARSVIEALQRKKDTSDTTLALQPVPVGKKVPFDTNTLRHIVPYVHTLVRRVRATMHEHDGARDTNWLSTSHDQSYLSQLFDEPPNNSPSHRKSRLPNLQSGKVSEGKENESDELNKRMNDMNLT